MTVGNVVGSNISNIALILGLSALIYPIAMKSSLLKRGIPLMILASGALVLLVLDGRLGRVEGGALVIGLIAYFWYVLRSCRTEPPETEAEFDAYQRERDCCPGDESRLRNVSLAGLGLALLAVGAHLIVASATVFAVAIGLSELVIGVTVVAIGTSLPELATSVLAALRKEVDIAVGNAVGSNVLNILGVLGPTALVRPLEIDRSLAAFELPIMMGVSLLLLPLAWTRFRLERWEGVLLLVGYTAFIAIAVLRGAAGG
jgi:cation:H+ antiporter